MGCGPLILELRYEESKISSALELASYSLNFPLLSLINEDKL